MSAHVLQNIAETGARPASTGNSAIDNPLANKKARIGAGAALGHMLVETLAGESRKLHMYVRNLVELDADGREGFRAFLKDTLKQMRDYAKSQGEAHQKMVRSATVRFSEFTTLSKAIDKGFKPDLENGTYHSIVVEARDFIGRDNRGKAKTSALIKTITFLKKVECLDGEGEAVKALLAQAVKLAEELGLAEGEGEEAPF
jgi:hypothetical protein